MSNSRRTHHWPVPIGPDDPPPAPSSDPETMSPCPRGGLILPCEVCGGFFGHRDVLASAAREWRIAHGLPPSTNPADTKGKR